MSQAEDELPETDHDDALAPSRWRWFRRALLGLLLIILAAIALTWFSREEIADNLIGDELDKLGVAATYEIERIGPDQQILINVVVGDPARPDLTIERIVVNVNYGFGIPSVGVISLQKARTYGSYRGGELSFGALDPLLFADTEEPAGLPEIDLELIDGRVLLETDYGPLALKADGKGLLSNGFAGMLAVAAPNLDGGGCSVADGSLYGSVAIDSGKPKFSGPLRIGKLSCPAAGIAVNKASIEIDGGSDADFMVFSGNARLATGAASLAGNAVGGLNGTLRGMWRDRGLNGTYSVAARSVGTAQLGAALITAVGTVRSRDSFEQVDLTADVEGNGVRLGDTIDTALADLIVSSEATLAAPLMSKMRAALKRESRGSRLAAQVNLRQTGQVATIMISQGSLRGGNGGTLLSLSRFQLNTAGSGTPNLSGNIVTGGLGLPNITGRMERSSSGNLVFRMRMAEYSSQGSTIAIPDLLVMQNAQGTLGFSGNVIATGPLPGGSTTNLVLPISGNYSAAGGLALWRKCTAVRFDQLALANLVFDRREITLCPADGQPILRIDDRGLRIVAGAPSLELSGSLADTPIQIASGPIGFAYPGAMSARDLDITLGEADVANRFTISNLDAKLGENISGTFSDADVRLFAVPLDLSDTSGQWDYTGGILSLAQGAFTVSDRSEQQRFRPLKVRGAALTLSDSIINAEAVLREPASDREIVRADILHDLYDATGFANLSVDALRFDDNLQPDQLSELAKGVIANAGGIINGSGRIDWNGEDVVSSGAFSSSAFDFAAAFGPVKGASGNVKFTDLINLTTAPDQRIAIASINPGIEVNDGEIVFSLRDGVIVSLIEGRWPFMGGTLMLEPVELNFGQPKIRAYVLDIQGLDAAQFLTQMELGNLSATGIFDGRIPLVFDAMGNGSIEGGMLVARPPGGNVSYVGELTYEDMSPMVNFAFDALRSLDYTEMQIGMEGSLSGEMVTKLSFDGVKQGEGTNQNFITRQIANLPIRFNVNVRAPFYQLITSIKAMYDPAFIKDPRELGLVPGTAGGPAPSSQIAPSGPKKPDTDEPPIQGSESERTS
jgi:hypothetical protein